MSGTFQIRGGKQLHGEITPQGAKNEALQILCAVLLTSEEVRIKNIPDIHDVNRLIEILGDFGVKITKNGHGDYTFKADNVNFDYIKSSEFKKNGARLRGSIMLLGPMLARYGEAYMPTPGGDKIGRRRLDTHFQGFVELGAEFSFDEKENFYTLKAKELQGNLSFWRRLLSQELPISLWQQYWQRVKPEFTTPLVNHIYSNSARCLIEWGQISLASVLISLLLREFRTCTAQSIRCCQIW